MSNQSPLNPDALAASAKVIDPGLYGDVEADLVKHAGFTEEKAREYVIAKKRRTEDFARDSVSAYLDVAQLVVNSVEELITTRAGLALANAAFNEGLSAGIRACNESLEGEPFVKPVSPYRSEVDE